MAERGISLCKGDRFASLDEFMQHFKLYQEATFTQFVMVATEKLPENDELCEKFKYRVVRYQCKQGRRHSKPASKHIRPLQRSFKVGCPVMINVRLNRRKGMDPFLKVTKVVLEHEGHERSKEMFQLYPEQRKIRPDKTDLTVLSARTMKMSERRQIMERKYGSAVLSQDVYNLQRQLKLKVKKEEGGEDEVQCEEILRDIVVKGGHGEFGRDENGDFLFVAFITFNMKKLLGMYPECLFMDCTYKVNDYLHPFLTIMVIDSEGHVLPVFHAFLARQDKVIIEKCLRIFAQQFSLASVLSFVVDKDMSEIAAIGTVFPDVPVNLCHLHVEQAVEGHLKKVLGMPLAIVSVILESFMAQVNTESDLEFDELKDRISKVVPQCVIDYFEANWWSKKSLWAACCNVSVLNFHAKTTNTLESYNGKIKKLVNKKLSLSNAMEAVLTFDEAKILDRKRKQILLSNSKVIDHSDNDEVSIKIKECMTRYGAHLVKQELEHSKKILYAVSQIPPDNYFISYKEKHHTCTINSCTCSVFGQGKIQCRHIFFLRRHLDLFPFDEGLVPDRFKQSNKVVDSLTLPYSPPDGPSVTTVPSVPCTLHTDLGQYRRAKDVCDMAVDFLSVLGVNEFQQKLTELEDFICAWSTKPTVTTNASDVPVTAASTSDTKKACKKSRKKRQREIPKMYSELTENDKVDLLLRSVSVHKSKPSLPVRSDELKPFSDYGDTVLDKQVDIKILEPFLEPAAWDLLAIGVATRVQDAVFYCGHCKAADNGELMMIQCDHCLKWYHLECVNFDYRSHSKVRTWFCEEHCL